MASNWQQTYEQLKKRKKEVDKASNTSEIKKIDTQYKFSNSRSALESDFAPTNRQPLQMPSYTKATDTVKPKKEEKKWYQKIFDKGAFDDGYNFGDVTKTILGTATDITQDVSKGILKVVEAPLDIGTNAVASGVGLFSDKTANKIRDFADKDLSENLSNIASNVNPVGIVSNLVNGTPENIINPTGIEYDKDKSFIENYKTGMKKTFIDDVDTNDYEESSLSGYYADKTTELVGYGLGMIFGGKALSGATGTASIGSKTLGASANAGNIGLSLAGKTLNIPTLAITGGMASGLEEANSKEGVTELERWSKATSSGLIEGISEGLFGMFGVGGIKNEAGKEIFDAIGEKGAKLFSSRAGKVLANAGIKSLGETAEEFISYTLNYFADNGIIDKLGEADFNNEWDWSEVGEQMALAFASSLIMQGGGSVIENNSAIAEAEKQLGRKLTAQEKATVTQASIEGSLEQKIGNLQVQVEEQELEREEQESDPIIEEAPVVEEQVTEQVEEPTTNEVIPPTVEQELTNITNQIDELETMLDTNLTATQQQEILTQLKVLEQKYNEILQQQGQTQDEAVFKTATQETIQNEEIAPIQEANVEQISQPTTQQVESNLATEVESNTPNVVKSASNEQNVQNEQEIAPLEQKTSTSEQQVMTEEEYLSSKGYGAMGYSEPGLHKSSARTSQKTRDKQASQVMENAEEYDAKREELRQEYQEKLKSGEIRKPTNVEKLLRTAQGHEDNQSVQSARKLLEKRGIDWKTGEKINKENKTPTQEELDNLEDTRLNKSGSEYASAFYDLEKKYGSANLYKGLNNYKSTGKALEQEIAPVKETIEDLTDTIKDTTKEMKALAKEIKEIKSSVSEVQDEFKALTELDLPMVEQQASENLRTATEDLAPVIENTTPEYQYENDNEGSTSIVESPLIADGRDMENVGSRKVKAYQYENPEVRPYFQDMARQMQYDLENSTKGQKMIIGDISQTGGGNFEYSGTKRNTTPDIADLLDNYNYTYADINKGLEAIIKDQGAENIAVAKRIEFALDDRLRNGYTTVDGFEVPANQEYIDLLRAKEFESYYSSIPSNDIAPVDINDNLYYNNIDEVVNFGKENQTNDQKTTSEEVNRERSNRTNLETYWNDKKTIRISKTGIRINDFKTDNGIVTTYEDTVPSISFKDTYNIVKNAKSTNEYGAFVDLHEEIEYSNMKNFSLSDGSGNISVTQDGDIISVAKSSNSKIKGASKQLLLTALKNGGKKLDNYNGFLTINYQKAGFEPVARVKFNPEYAPDDWNFERDGQPDIIVMKHNGDSAETVEANYGKYPFTDIETLPYMEYDEAIAYRDSLLETEDIGPVGNQSLAIEQAPTDDFDNGGPMIRVSPEMQKRTLNKPTETKNVNWEALEDTSKGEQQHLKVKKLGETLEQRDVDWDSIEDTSNSKQKQYNAETGQLEDAIEKKTKKEIREKLLKDTGILNANLDEANKIPKLLMENTDPIRLQEMIFGRGLGNQINDMFFQKVKDNTSEKIRFQNKERAEIKDLGIKARSKESSAVQKYGEKQWVNEVGDVVPYGDKELSAEFPDVETQNKIKTAAKVIRDKYDSYLDTTNKVLTELGYNPIPKRNDYMRHFQELNDIFSRVGIPYNYNEMTANDLPTDINGLTHDFSPSKNFFANALERKGNKTTYDAITGIDGYLEGIGNLIYHTEDIQRLRAFEQYIRDTYGENHGFDNIELLSDEQKAERVEKIQDNHLSNYASWLHEYTNTLAGKKSIVDRGVEHILGRRIYSFLNTTKSQVGKNMIGFNIGSAMTNAIAGVQTLAKTNKIATVKGLSDTVKNIFRNDGFVDKNNFLTSRFGSDSISKNWWQKVGDAGFMFMQGMDHFVSNFVVRSKYNELKSKGLSDEQAHAEAGKYASKLMSDRSQGAMPNLYNSQILGIVTQFQNEVNNQVYSMFYDTYHESRESAQGNALKTTAGMTFTLGQLAVFTHIFGQAFESLAGYNPTFDIIGMLMKAFGFDDDEDSEDTVGDNLEQALKQLGDALPYVNIITGGGRIPIGEALPIKELASGKDEFGNDKSRLKTLSEALPYYVLPTGYSQIKKTTQGLGMYDEDLPIAGSYTDSGNLRFTADESTWGKVQAGVFGRWANDEAQAYVDSEFKTINKASIDELVDLDMVSSEYRKLKSKINKAGKKVEDKVNYIATLDELNDSQKNILVNNILDRDYDVDVSNYEDYSSYDEFNFYYKNREKYDWLKTEGISYEEYSATDESKELYNYAYRYPETYKVGKAITGDFATYKEHADYIWDLKADKDENGDSISGTKKTKVISYVNDLELSIPQKAMLIRKTYSSFDDYNNEIVDYVSGLDADYDTKKTILEELDFTLDDEGNVYWD